MDGVLQYRFMVSEGVEDSVINDEDNLRFAGRVSLSLLEPETGWFNKGTYLGKKKVLSIGLGADSQDDLMLGGTEDDNSIWTVDVFFDHPLGDGAITAEAAYIDIEHCTTHHDWVDLDYGDDAENWYVQAGYLFPFHFQPYVRYETVDVDKKDETDILSVGANYYLKGHNCKISADYTNVDPDDSALDDHDIITVQFAVGF
jgi:predicted porin